MSQIQLILAVTGVLAGFVDSIAGGGGLITLPVLASILGPGANAIGTNKIVALPVAAVAFWVYLKKQKLRFKKGFAFVLSLGLGSFLGSLAAPHFPKIYFQYFLILTCPVILWFLWNKKIFLQECLEHPSRGHYALIFSGLGVGFYDGFFGPGGGTFMLLALLWGARLPLFEALLLSKLSNTVSAGVALSSYAAQGYVHYSEGLVMAAGGLVGGYCGSRLASARAEKLVRPFLVLVVSLLLLVQMKQLLGS